MNYNCLLLLIVVCAGAGCLPSDGPPRPDTSHKPVVLDETGQSLQAMEKAGYKALSEACSEISRDTRNGIIQSPADQQKYFDQAVSQIREQKQKAMSATMQKATRVNGKWDSEASAAAFDSLSRAYGELAR